MANCAAMDSYGKCKKCYCLFEEHRHIYYVTKLCKKTVINQNQMLKIDSEEKASKEIQKVLVQTEQLIKEMNEEIEIIQKISAKFAYVLVKDSNTVRNFYKSLFIKLN